jgi:PKHD-type hydroxylase
MSAFSPTFPRPLGGPLIAWEGAFSPSEIDRITAIGDGLVRERAELVLADDPFGKKRVTDVSWLERGEKTHWLYARLEQIVQQLNSQYYKYDIYRELREPLQYTVYESSQGGHYNWHVDHGAGGPDARKLSISVQLSDPSAYQGCDLELDFGDDDVPAPRARGTVVIFSSYVLHRVTPITAGVRKSLVAWVSGPQFK